MSHQYVGGLRSMPKRQSAFQTKIAKILRLGFRFTLVTLICTVAARAATQDAVVVIYAQFPGYNTYEIGTGTFVDHDGLVLTADHVVHHLSLSPPVSYMANSVPTPVKP